MDFNAKVEVKSWDIPAFRQQVAHHHGVLRKFAFITYGGLGDVLCAEPTIRYAVEVLKPALGVESITVITRFPELFSHLPVETIQAGPDGKVELGDEAEKKYHYFYCGQPDDNLQNYFFTHNSMMPVDYPALSALRTQLPLKYRTIKTAMANFSVPISDRTVVLHPGNHWQSKRFPRQWWNAVIARLYDENFDPILIGGKPGDEAGTVEVDVTGCIDLREQLSIEQSAYLLNKAPVLLTNDSFPLHLATTGNCRIGFFATAKDPEWLMHWRESTHARVQFGWRMENLAIGGAYQRSFTPKIKATHLSKATQEEVLSWLPSPASVVQWVASKAEYP